MPTPGDPIAKSISEPEQATRFDAGAVLSPRSIRTAEAPHDADAVFALIGDDVDLRNGADDHAVSVLEPPVSTETAPSAATTGPAAAPVATGDDLALATEVAAAVETEIDEDPEWALLARGPSAFPADQAEPELSPKPKDDKPPAPDRPRE
jgi:hypothetical protein